MKSTIAKRSVVINGHKTSVSLEPAFWELVREIAKERKTTISDLVASIDCERAYNNLSSAIRLFVLDACKQRALAPAAVVATVPATPVQATDPQYF